MTDSLKIDLSITLNLGSGAPAVTVSTSAGSPLLSASGVTASVIGPQLGPGTSNLFQPGGAISANAYDPGAKGHVYAWETQAASGSSPAHWTEDWIRKGAAALPWSQGLEWVGVPYDPNAVGGNSHRYTPSVESRLASDAQAAGTAPWQRMNLDLVYEVSPSAAEIQARYPATLGNNALGWAEFQLTLNGGGAWGHLLRLIQPGDVQRDFWVFLSAVPRFQAPDRLTLAPLASGGGPPPGNRMPRTWLLDRRAALGASWTWFVDTSGVWVDI